MADFVVLLWCIWKGHLWRMVSGTGQDGALFIAHPKSPLDQGEVKCQPPSWGAAEVRTTEMLRCSVVNRGWLVSLAKIVFMRLRARCALVLWKPCTHRKAAAPTSPAVFCKVLWMKSYNLAHFLHIQCHHVADSHCQKNPLAIHLARTR